jgi:hypothetical protein
MIRKHLRFVIDRELLRAAAKRPARFFLPSLFVRRFGDALRVADASPSFSAYFAFPKRCQNVLICIHSARGGH